MQVVHAICGGLDVHQAQLTACVRQVHLDGQVTQEVREFATTSPAGCLENFLRHGHRQ